MFKRVIALLLLILPTASLAQDAAPRSAARPCRAQPALVGKCFRVYGRLALYNGTPTIRLWRAGTNRVLGVSGSYAHDGYSSIPEELERQLAWETELWGEYLVCPYTRRRPGAMQLVCIEAGKGVNARQRRVRPVADTRRVMRNARRGPVINARRSSRSGRSKA